MGNSSSSAPSSFADEIGSYFTDEDIKNFQLRLELQKIVPNRGNSLKLKEILALFPFVLHPYTSSVLNSSLHKSKQSPLTRDAIYIDFPTLFRFLNTFVSNDEDQICSSVLNALRPNLHGLNISVKLLTSCTAENANEENAAKAAKPALVYHRLPANVSTIENSLVHFLAFSFLELLLSKFVGTPVESYLLNVNIFKDQNEISEILKAANADDDLRERFTRFHSVICSLYANYDQQIISIALPCIYASYKHFQNAEMRQNRAETLATAVNWIKKSLPALPSFFGTSFVSHLTSCVYAEDSNKTPKPEEISFQLYKWIDRNEEKESNPRALKRTQTFTVPESHNINQSSDGLKGILLNHTSRCLTSEMCFALSMSAREFTTNRWTRLYATWRNGTSLTALASTCLSYQAPSFLIIKASGGHVFGGTFFSGFGDNGKQFFGSHKCFLFSCEPVFRIFQASGKEENYNYLNVKQKLAPIGIGFGGTRDLFRLWIDSDLSRGYVTTSDGTFTDGNILLESNSTEDGDLLYELPFQRHFKIDALELWGTGDFKALSDLEDELQMHDQVRQERRNVDRSKFLQSEFDKNYLLRNTFSKNDESSRYAP